MKTVFIKNSNRFAIVDDEVFERIKDYKYSFGGTGCGRIQRCYRFGNYIKTVSLANDVKNTKGILYDHKDLDPFNCLNNNLRQCNHSQNNANRNKQNGNYTSRYKGVSLVKATGKWKSCIRFNKRLIVLGSFISEIDAAEAYNKKAVELFGSFARINNLVDEKSTNAGIVTTTKTG